MEIERFFQPFKPIILREIARGRIWTVRPLTVIEDTPETIALYMAPSAIYLHPRELNSDLVPRHLLANEWRLVEKIWFGGGALYLSKKDAPYRVIGFRSNENTVFENWYVNLQEPLKRTNLGFDYLDMELDVEVSGDLKSYHLKDVNKFEELVQMGVIETEKANFLRKTAFSVAEEIIDGKSIVEKWKNWSPESDLRPAPLPKGWDVI